MNTPRLSLSETTALEAELAVIAKLDIKTRPVYTGQKRYWGEEARNGYKFFSNVRNQARLATAEIVGVPVNQVKYSLKRTGGP
jgi:hypothetical protein